MHWVGDLIDAVYRAHGNAGVAPGAKILIEDRQLLGKLLLFGHREAFAKNSVLLSRSFMADVFLCSAWSSVCAEDAVPQGDASVQRQSGCLFSLSPSFLAVSARSSKHLERQRGMMFLVQVDMTP